ncbi:hypothetical protein NQZ68_021098 [Dissostichus eleginoides]|nr:hypothetical protein NQZ68_021098 [Dissostichus eleginoides]
MAPLIPTNGVFTQDWAESEPICVPAGAILARRKPPLGTIWALLKAVSTPPPLSPPPVREREGESEKGEYTKADEVEVEVESMDKAGNFIGWLHIEGLNLSIALVEGALSKIHFTAERSNYYKTLVSAEEACRERKEKVWLSVNIF